LQWWKAPEQMKRMWSVLMFPYLPVPHPTIAHRRVLDGNIRSHTTHTTHTTPEYSRVPQSTHPRNGSYCGCPGRIPAACTRLREIAAPSVSAASGTGTALTQLLGTAHPTNCAGHPLANADGNSDACDDRPAAAAAAHFVVMHEPSINGRRSRCTPARQGYLGAANRIVEATGAEKPERRKRRKERRGERG
jgi:hypothetical protein